MIPTPPILRRLAALAVLVCSFSTVLAADKNDAFRAALDSIRQDKLQHYVDYLADDQREGREAGSRGGRAAGDYVIAQLTRLRFRGAGVDGSYAQPFPPNFRNIVAILEGSDPKLKQEVVVVGGHYDHVGYGKPGNSFGPFGVIHNGADDNASGVSGVLELAQAFNLLPRPPRRSVLFAFWDAEEKGLLGSQHWVAHPTLPLERVVVFFNLDMIGRLRKDRLLVLGTRSGVGFRRLVSTHNEEDPLGIEFPWGVAPIADHYAFFNRGIPILALHTDLHAQYHRPSDKANLINSAGMRQIVRLLFRLVYDAADQYRRPVFRNEARQETESARRSLAERVSPLPDRLGAGGAQPAAPGHGVRIGQIAPDAPAARAGLRPGDCVLRINGRVVQTGGDLDAAIRIAPTRTTLSVEKTGQAKPIDLQVELSGNPLRLGITWRIDDAEPGTLVLTHVLPNSPAARAGLQTDDRIYQIEGKDFSTEAEAAERLRNLPGPIRLQIERAGRLRPIEIRLEAQPLQRAA